MTEAQERLSVCVFGGVDTHKDLHVAAVVDGQDHLLATQCFATTRQGYRQMLSWMQLFGQLQRVGIESTGSYGAGLLRFMQAAGVDVLEVTTPDRHDRRRRGKNDDLDAQNAAHAAFRGQRTVTPKNRNGMIEALRVLKACRKTAVAARRVALQMIHNTIVAAPAELREILRKLTRMQLVRTLAAWRPDLSDFRNLVSAYRISLKSLARRYLELHDEIADLDTMIGAIVETLAPTLLARNSIGHECAAQLLLTAGDNVERLRSEASFAALCGVSPVPASSGKVTRHRLNRAATARPTARCISSSSDGSELIRAPRSTCSGASPRAIPSSRQFVASSATSREKSSISSASDIARSHRPRLSLDTQKGVRGSQYAAGDYRDILQAVAIVQSMSRKGNCWDNAPMESFFGTLKTELVHHGEYPNRDAARRDLFAYVEGYYNRQRRHSAIGYITPEQAEAKAA